MLTVLFYHRLEAATVEALEGLDKSVLEKYEKLKDLNDKKIKLRCSEIQRRIEVTKIVVTLSLGFEFYML